MVTIPQTIPGSALVSDMAMIAAQSCVYSQSTLVKVVYGLRCYSSQTLQSLLS